MSAAIDILKVYGTLSLLVSLYSTPAAVFLLIGACLLAGTAYFDETCGKG